MKLKFKVFLFLFCTALFVKAQTKAVWSASGILLSPEGYIATNNHALEEGYHFEVDVFIDGVKKTFPAISVKADPLNNLEILKIEDPAVKTIGAAPFAFPLKSIKEGEKIFAMGYPQIGSPTEDVQTANGIISSKSGFQNDLTMYQISCGVEPGNAGGPLFDNFGNLIGIINSGIKSGQPVSYAIKISCLSNLIDIIPKIPQLPAKTTISGLPNTSKITTLAKFVVSIRVSNQKLAAAVAASTAKLAIGQSYGGGIIFYIDETGEHGLVASFDYGDSQRVKWGCSKLAVDETSVDLGTGRDNTKAIVKTCNSNAIAARLCSDLVLNGYSDWYLPSKAELNLLYLQKDNIGGYEHGYYWSSSEFDDLFAWYQHFDFGFQDYLNKDFAYYYRPIRSF